MATAGNSSLMPLSREACELTRLLPITVAALSSISLLSGDETLRFGRATTVADPLTLLIASAIDGPTLDGGLFDMVFFFSVLDPCGPVAYSDARL